MNKIFLYVILISVFVGVIVLIFFMGEQKATSAPLSGVEMEVYKSPTCGCCAEYITYLKRNGASVSVEETTDMNSVKNQHGIPMNLESCHTTLVSGYVVEGHVPVEAITKLLQEKPDIAGISLPEMPAGSPGMGGVKIAPFKIYSITHEGERGELFTEI